MRIFALLASLAALAGCGDDGEDLGEPAFPEDYEASYVEVRDCRQSAGAHGINHIRVLADPAALGPYTNRTDPFPVGAVVLKEEYTDPDCAGEILQWSVMVKLGEGEAPPDQLGWHWQEVRGGDRAVTGQDVPRCWGCHSACTPEADGYDFTCTVP